MSVSRGTEGEERSLAILNLFLSSHFFLLILFPCPHSSDSIREKKPNIPRFSAYCKSHCITPKLVCKG